MGVQSPGRFLLLRIHCNFHRLRKFFAFPIMRITVLLTVVNLHILIATITLMVGRSHVQGGGRGGGRMSNSSQGGRGHYGRNSNSSYNNNSGNDDHHNRKTYADGNQGRGKSLFKHDMILDPWEQLAKRMVPQGLLDATELDNHFCPQVSVVQTSVRVSNPLSDGRLPARFENEGTDIEDDIEDLKAQLLDQI